MYTYIETLAKKIQQQYKNPLESFKYQGDKYLYVVGL